MASAGLPTNELTASFSAQALGDGIHVFAALIGPIGEEVRLASGDSLAASANGGPAIALSPEDEDAATELHEIGTLPQNTGPADVVISLRRRGANESAPRSEVVVAPSFTIASTPPATVVVGNPLPISVAPPPVPIAGASVDLWSVQASGSCLVGGPSLPFVVDVDAQGDATFDTSVLSIESGGCDVMLQVRRETAGTLDPAFANSVDDSTGDAAVTWRFSADSGPSISLLEQGTRFEGVQARSFLVHLVGH